LLKSLPNARAHVCYSHPAPEDAEGIDFDSAGRVSAALLAELDLPLNAEAYICGPIPFMDEMSAALAAHGLEAVHLHTEPFGTAARSSAAGGHARTWCSTSDAPEARFPAGSCVLS